MIKEINIPKTFNKEIYLKGYRHGMISNELTDFRASFRAGFRLAKMELRNQNNIRNLPKKLKFTGKY